MKTYKFLAGMIVGAVVVIDVAIILSKGGRLP